MTIEIVVDFHEKKERKEMFFEVASLFKDEGCIVREGKIDVGDYLVYHNKSLLFSVEWKTYSDFVSSIVNGHLSSQLDDMDQYERPFLFITGNYDTWIKKARKLGLGGTREQIAGYLTSIAGRHKTKCVMYESEKEGVNGVLKLLSIFKGTDTRDVKLPERKKYTGDPRMDMFLSLPGVGPKKAKQYNDMFGFYSFLEYCRGDNAKDVFKHMGVSVPSSLIEYCRKL